MKHLLLTTIAAVLLVGCGSSMSILEAANKGNIEAVKQHLDAGTDVNAKDSARWTPLHYAAANGHKEVVELLIARGADVNAKDVNGGTPLHIAAFRDQKETAKLLIAKGADVNAKMVSGAKKGNTPLDAANETGNTETINFLRKHGGKTGAELEAEGK